MGRKTSTMAALHSGQWPRPSRSSRAQPPLKVWPHGMKGAPLARAIHTRQHQPPAAPALQPGSGRSASSSSPNGSSSLGTVATRYSASPFAPPSVGGPGCGSGGHGCSLQSPQGHRVAGELVAGERGSGRRRSGLVVADNV